MIDKKKKPKKERNNKGLKKNTQVSESQWVSDRGEVWYIYPSQWVIMSQWQRGSLIYIYIYRERERERERESSTMKVVSYV